MPKKDENAIHCSFCGKPQDQVSRLIAGPGGVFICNECVELCREIIDEEMVEVFSRKAECEPPKKTVTVVMCPECHEEMTVPKMACYRKPAIGIRDEDYEV